MGANLPPYLGWVFGGAILILAAVALGALALAAARDLRHSEFPPSSPWRPTANPHANRDADDS
jgi:hypothetical protein